jgi:hypothetical protein
MADQTINLAKGPIMSQNAGGLFNPWIYSTLKTRIAMNTAQQRQLQEQGEELSKLLRQMMLTLGPLDADYNLAGKHWRDDKQNRQFWPRVVLRCLCADIEARLFVFRRTALEVAKLSKASLTKEETEILTETRTVLEKGVQTTKPKWLPIKDAVKESLRLFAKSHGATFIVDCGTKGCKALCDTFSVRHRLMHPKDIFAVEVRDTDIQVAENGIHWFNQQCQSLLDQCQAHTAASIRKELERLRDKVKEGA